MARSAVDQLARSTEAELLEVHGHRSILLLRAHALSVAANHDPDIARCEDGGCLLVDVDPSGRLCAVSHRLAGLVDGSPEVSSIDVELAAFRQALAGSFEAVRACRQTAHPSGYCWFSSIPGDDGCGEVLHLAHRLS